MIQFLDNVCLLTDSYKVSHYKQYPPKTQIISSYFESRKGSLYPETVFFGLQYFLKQYLAGPIVTQEKINEAEEIFNLHFGYQVFPKDKWEYILNQHGGYLPIKINAAPEGTIVKESNVLMTVENTDENCYWLTNYLETLLVQTWYASTVATQSRFMKQTLLKYLEETGDPSLIDFKLHDFGFRGVTCPEQAAIGGAAHLVNFKGTDTVPGILLARKFYEEKMAGFSIPAAEHSTITSWLKEHEVDACRNMLTQYPHGLVAVVSDSYDIFNCCENIWGGQLKEQVLSRDGVLVVRPDSGDPPVIVCKVLEILGSKFGFTVNSKGYKVLHPKVRVIQGDGIDSNMLTKILQTMQDNGWSADNIAFGSGGGLLQKLNRDTQKFAFKCSYALVDGQPRNVFKQPITDNGKTSKAGLIKLIKENGKLITVPENYPGDNVLQTVYLNGIIQKEQTFQQIRDRVV